MNIAGKQIARTRRRLNISQAELKNRCKVAGLSISRPVIAKIETNSRRVSDVELVAFSRALKVSVSRLLGLR
jgi:transcriptional regulator with XRE-family HTH domain